MIELGIREYIEYLKTIVNADLLLDNNNNLSVNGTIIVQDLTPEAIDELKNIWQSSGLSEVEFYDYFDEFILQEIQQFLNSNIEKNNEVV
jgi:phosphopantothenate synthetase